jgi:hypothetical protein
MTNLTYTHLQFDCIAETPINFGGDWAGNRLRGALGYVLLRTTCDQDGRGGEMHTAHCPACWLLRHKLDPAHARRAYSVVPPLPAPERVLVGQRFSFTITLFGEGWQFLPYFVLAVGEMGRSGVGRGTFQIASITARNPLIQQEEVLLTPGDDLVQVPELIVEWQDTVAQSSALITSTSSGQTSQSLSLTLQFLTPTRLIDQKHLMKQPQFDIFFRRLLHRIDTLGTQLANVPRREWSAIEHLHALADSVQLVDNRTNWVELRPRSGRDRQYKPMSGFVGEATYQAVDWSDLLSILLFGQGIQVGKLATKGNGVYQVVQADGGYWINTMSANRRELSAKNDLREKRVER